MELIGEILFELVFEAVFEAAFSRKVSHPVRLICALLILVFWFGLSGFVIYLGVRDRSLALGLLGVFLIVLFCAGVIRKWREQKRNENI